MSELSYDLTPGLVLSDEELAAAGYTAGWRGTDLATITAIGGSKGGQSGGSPGSIGVGQPPSDYEYSVGNAQINVSPSGGSPGLAAKYGGVLELLSPTNNLSAARTLFQGAGNTFRPWETGAEYAAGYTPAQVGAAYLAADPQATVAAETVSNLPASQVQQLAQQANAATSSALGAYPTPPTPPSPSQTPPDTATGPSTGPNSPSNPSSPAGEATIQAGEGVNPLPAQLALAGLLDNPIFNALTWIDNAMHPQSPGVAKSIGSLGSADLAYFLQIGSVRLAFALPGVVGLLVALGFSYGAIISDVIHGGSPRSRAGSSDSRVSDATAREAEARADAAEARANAAASSAGNPGRSGSASSHAGTTYLDVDDVNRQGGRHRRVSGPGEGPAF